MVTLGESSFAYHGLETLPPPSVKGSHAMQVKTLVKDYLEGIHFDTKTPFLKDHDLEEAVWSYVKNLDMGEQVERLALKKLKITVTLSHQTYTSFPFELKVPCAIQGLYMFLIEDSTPEMIEDLQHFGQNFVLNKRHRSAIFNNFDAHLRGLSRYYGPHCHSTIIKSTFDFINGRVIEHEMEQSGFQFSSDTRLMPMFLRSKVGGTEILFHMLWPKSLFPEEQYLMHYFPVAQEMALFMDFTNDILSYYKECIIGDDKDNFVSNFGEAHQVKPLDVLRSLALYIPQVLASVYRFLEDKEDLRKPIEQFVTGWVLLMTAHRRYHLVELFADEQYLPPYDEDA
ncbi:terpenoid synthase [Aspergillus coremiiformis]|uniref:Terpenoid synthase n=1 Tax=Aspergillus coremiiformis TaxID=138285 RepID=A0A5N6ZG78_9EURO|nr:terpenoid synthase [Aspergillus coremiiformis]